MSPANLAGLTPVLLALVGGLEMVQYVATINVPGYLPQDDDPPVFDTAQEAWAYLADERERGEDGSELLDATATLVELNRVAMEARWTNGAPTDLGVNPDGTGTVYGDTPGYDGNHDLGLAYSVTLAE